MAMQCLGYINVFNTGERHRIRTFKAARATYVDFQSGGTWELNIQMTCLSYVLQMSCQLFPTRCHI